MDFVSTAIFTLICIWFFLVRRTGSGPRKYTICKKNDFPEVKYERKLSKLPVARAGLLKIITRLLNSFVGNHFLASIALKLNHMTFFRTKQMEEDPTFFPNHGIQFSGECAQPKKYTSDVDIKKCLTTESDDKISKVNGIYRYTKAYRDGTTNPREVVEEIIISFVKAKSLNSILRFNAELAREAADASAQRYLDKQTLSPIDGVPFVIKDELPVAGYRYTCGTSFLGKTPEEKDCETVRRLKSLGAVIVGISNMHELGLGTTGGNSNKGFGTARNPYNMEHYTGGSSSGSASAVAAGLCAAAIGTDGGGSIRIPSSYCGVVGLKPTFGRISLAGLRPITFSVGHSGPICSSVKDTALLYTLLAYPDPEYSIGLPQPPISVPDFSESIEGMRIGIFHDYFKDCDEDIYHTCDTIVKLLGKEKGCVVKSIGIPELDEARYAHLIIILSEMTNCIQYEYDHNLQDMTYESQLLFTVGCKVTAIDYTQACKQRTRSINFFKKLFEEVDVIITPSTGQTAPRIHPDDLVAGSIDIERDMKSMRYVYLGNLIGLPCISVPVGYDKSGLPIGLQIMGPWWKEDVILKLANQVEAVRGEYQLPSIYFDVLRKK